MSDHTKPKAKTEDSTQTELEKIESSKFLVLGNVDAGKSSFVGVMEKNVLDDGNGYARSLITKIKHEKDTGRTSTHSPHYLIKNNEITTLIDLCGHEKYLKTTMFGVMGLFGDYGIVMVGANMGICGMTTEHIALLVANRIPFIVVVTKIDICPENVMTNVKKDLERIAKRHKKEIHYFEKNEEIINGSYLKDAHKTVIEAFQDRDISIMPVVMVSNKTGHNINFARELITTIKSRAYLIRKGVITPNEKTRTSNYPMIMFIDSTFSVTGIGIVLSGTVKYGTLSLGQKVFLGPVNNTYITITVKSLQNCISENVSVLHENESGSIGIRLDTKGSYTREMFSKGQIVTTDMDFAMKHTCYTFNCDVAIFNHPTTIRNGYQTVIHCGTIRQTGKFKIKDDVVLRTNSKQNIDIKFLQRPEFILPGTYFMFRDGRTKGMGRVNSGIPFVEDNPEPLTRSKKGSRKRSERKKAKVEKDTLVSNTAMPKQIRQQTRPNLKKKPAAVVNV
ncbi:putative GTP-binding translation elongation/initiation factor [Tupanvirus soda lake]|uniref:GTP-binding translation elongation/initiation factor n=2 Tax=Tupanvirus TaxID=2094720 RepID=A0AC62AAL8_9VIRU|nr:putative GTP-binding translation elongation/initiation factor [Tupanvirus soda lake]QKU34693.1 putative GTP-binding translation elongation/initiation factor [Tupanvirus soda lake]